MAREDFIPKGGASKGKGVNFLSGETAELIRRIAARPVVEMDPKHFDYTERDGVRFYRLKKELVPDGGTRGRGYDRFGVWLDVGRQQLMVDVGSILYHTQGGDAIALPIIPKIGDRALNDKDADGWGPGFPVGGLNSGTLYSVVVYFRAGDCSTNIPDPEDLEEIEDDEDINTVQLLSPNELTEEMPHYKGRLIVAEVEFKAGDLGKEIDTLTQLFGSDLVPNCTEAEESSSGTVSDSGDGDGDGSAGSSGGDGGDPEDPDSGSGSSDQDPCCPGISHLEAIVVSVGSELGGAGCFYNDYDQEEVVVDVAGHVGVIPNTPDCQKCVFRFQVEYGIGMYQYAEQIGGGGHNFGHRFTFMAAACESRTVWARVRRFGVPTSSNGCEQLTNCDVSKTVKMPPVCGEDCEESSETEETTIIPPP